MRPGVVSGLCFRERPPGLIQHVLTVLVFGSWVLPPPRLPPLSRSLRLCPWASILLHGPLDICSDLLPAAPPPPVQKRDAQHMFLQHRGAHAECWVIVRIFTGFPSWKTILCTHARHTFFAIIPPSPKYVGSPEPKNIKARNQKPILITDT